MSSLTAEFFVTGGTLRRDAACYVVRQADHDLLEGLRRGKFCYVLTSRQMGKSSLMVRAAAQLREEGCGVVILDLTAIGQNLSAEQWYRGLLGQMGYQLELEDELIEFWRGAKELGAMQRWMRAIREVVLPRYPGPVIVFVDEIDAVRSLPFSTDEFFAAIREFYNRRTDDEELERLTFCLLGVASPSDLIRDTRTTPFNIGQRIELRDFTEAETISLARGLSFDEKTATGLLKRIHHWTNGHPYLTQRLCQAIAESNPPSAPPSALRAPQSVDQFCQELFFSPRAKERDDNLLFVRERMLRGEVDLAGLLSLYEQIHRGKRARDDEANPLVSVLRLSGIARVEGGRLRVSNRIYARVFDLDWIRTNMPDAELRRQRAAFRRGLLRAAAVAAVIITTIAALALFAIRQRNAAEQARAEALSRELAANAVVQLPQDPELSVLLAIEALRVAPTTQAEDALRQSLPESHLQAVMRGHTDAVSSAAFSPDGRMVITVSFDHTAHVWNVSDGRHLAELRGHGGKVVTGALSPDGQMMLTGGYDGTARVWEARSGRELKQLRGHTSKVVSVAFSPNGNLALTSSWDGTARIWEVSAGQSWKELRGHASGRGLTGGAAFSPDGKLVATSGGYEARVWVVIRDDVATELRGHTDQLLGASFSPDGQLIATASKDGTARLWEAGAGRSLKELRGHTGWVRSAEFSPDGKLLVTASEDKTAVVWEVSTGRRLQELRGHTKRVWGASFSPDGQRVVTASEDGAARIWETGTGRSLVELRGHTDRVDSASFSPDGKLVVTAGWDKTARIWETGAGRNLIVLRGHTDRVSGAAFSPDGKWIVTGSYDSTVRVWEASSGRLVRELRGHRAYVTSVAFSPDGQFVVAASVDGTARIWQAGTGQIVTQIRGHSDEIWNAAFSPDGKYVVTAGYDKTARIYACEVCRPIQDVLALARKRVTRSLTPEEREKYLHEPPLR